jgi:predicted enzyme related to lactoylglutathione lyase
MVIRNVVWPEGTPCWVDLAVDDVDKAVTFYSILFGWEPRYGGPEEGGYVTCTLNDHVVAGIGPRTGTTLPPMWTTYLAADYVDKVAERIADAGGELLLESVEVGDHGWMAIGVDPMGATFGVWEAAGRTGTEIVNEPGALVWNEQVSHDLDGAKSFYEAVFGYTYDDIETGPYAMLKVSGIVCGGLGVHGPGAPAHAPSHWRAYFEVADTDHTMQAVPELGGRVLFPPTDTPYGRLASAADDQGAMFFVIQGTR